VKTPADKPKVGKLRPTQVVTQHGPGAVVDLPELSIIVAGLDDWVVRGPDRVAEPRLEAFLRVPALYRPPVSGPGAYGGVPAWVFPDWLVCPVGRCRLLAPRKDFQWVAPPAGEYRCPRTDRHGNAKWVQAFPARFMVACPKGHLDDFPWHEWAHRGPATCGGPLKLLDYGRSGSANDLEVRCESCDAGQRLGDAFKARAIEHCSARRPWLAPDDHEPTCDDQPRVILRGASNAYFGVVASALSIPPYSDPIQMDVAPYAEIVKQADSVEKLVNGVAGGFYELGDLLQRHPPDQVWNAVHGEVTVTRLRPDEYRSFLDPPEPAQPPHEFEVRHMGVPHGPEAASLSVVAAATRLREVRALRGFTRIDSGFDIGELADVSKLDPKVAPISKTIGWRPAVELRGEGIFLSLDAAALHAWERTPSVAQRGDELAERFDEYQRQRVTDPEDRHPFPGMRFVMLHSLAHALIRQLCLEAGYSSSALRERIYSDTGEQPMAGLLIYTASSDSEGSLGGLVDQAPPDRFGPLLLDAMRDAELCAQDPLCGGGEIGGAGGINGAACHACLLLAETSCEAGNRFLDRATLVETLGAHGRAFLRGT
jgi:hypothetical protein